MNHHTCTSTSTTNSTTTTTTTITTTTTTTTTTTATTSTSTSITPTSSSSTSTTPTNTTLLSVVHEEVNHGNKYNTTMSDHKQAQSQIQVPVAEFTLVLIGDGSVGKSSFIERHKKGTFVNKYFATNGVETHSLCFNTSEGPINVIIRVTSGQENFGSLRDNYYKDAHGAIIMYDVLSRITYKNVPNWYRDFKRVCENVPVVIVANKVDGENELGKYGSDLNRKKKSFKTIQKIPLMDISVKSGYKFDQPMLWLLQKLMNNDDLTITSVQEQQHVSTIEGGVGTATTSLSVE